MARHTEIIAEIIAQRGCRWCNMPRVGHLREWWGCPGWHPYSKPTDGQVLARVRRARKTLR